MKSYVQKRDKAIFLRKNGSSYTEISQETGVSVSTLSIWLKKIPLAGSHTEDLKKRVAGKMAKGRLKALVVNKSKRIYKEKKIYENASKEFEMLMKNPIFSLGIGVLWGRGSKQGNNFRILSEDNKLVDLIYKWLLKYLNLENDQIIIKKQKNYTELYVRGVDNYRKIKAWQKLLMQYYDNVLKNK